MTDATQGHHHAHDHAVVHSHAAPARALPRASLLELSAAARLLGVSLAIAALWAAVYWAVH